jgi:hypothetical protein
MSGMKKVKKLLKIKPLKTIKENSKWKNIKTINTKTKNKTKNKDLEKLVNKWKLPWYEVVNPKEDKEKFLRSKKDKFKKNNLDPKIKITKPKKISKKNNNFIFNNKKICLIYDIKKQGSLYFQL